MSRTQKEHLLTNDSKWAEWSARLRSLASAGIPDADKFDHERYTDLLALADQMAAEPSERAALYPLKPKAPSTPKVDVRGVVFREDAILLVRELIDNGRWTLPGGWVDINQSPSEAVEREVLEETGYVVRAARLIMLVDKRNPRHAHPPDANHIYKIFILCELLDDQRSVPAQESAKNQETADAAFFTEAQTDGLDLSFGRVTPTQLARCFAYHHAPHLPPEFD